MVAAPSAADWPRELPLVQPRPSLPISREGWGHMKGSSQPISSKGQGSWGPLAHPCGEGSLQKDCKNGAWQHEWSMTLPWCALSKSLLMRGGTHSLLFGV